MDDRATTHYLPDLLGDDAWAALTRHMVTRTFQPGDTIVERGDLAPDFHVIESGAAAVIAATAAMVNAANSGVWVPATAWARCRFSRESPRRRTSLRLRP